MSLKDKLFKPAKYFPLEKGIYEVGAGLRPLSFDFENGPIDQKAFQIDQDYERFLANKVECRNERMSKYVCEDVSFTPENQRAVCEWMFNTLTKEYPDLFQVKNLKTGSYSLDCLLTGETIIFDKDFRLMAVSGVNAPAYLSTYDALCSQVQEDVAVMVIKENGENLLQALHLCAPSHWAAEDKIGKDFAHVHAPVPGMEKLNQNNKTLIESIVARGPFVRFVWSFVTDTRLNHHPEPPRGKNAAEWRGRVFNSESTDSPFFIRVERQSLHPVPSIRGFVFLIRISFVDGSSIRADETKRNQLVAALRSMSPEARKYKGVDHCFDEIVGWLSTKN